MLAEGKLTVKSSEVKREFFIKGGLARFEGNRLVVICDIEG